MGERPDIDAECLRLARVLTDREARIIGLVPAGDEVAIPPVALQLGRSLAELVGSPVAVIDAYGNWPGTEGLAAGSDTTLFAATWLVDNLALLAPRTFDSGALLPQLGAALRAEASVFNRLLVDLTGFDHLGEHLAALALVDAVLIVARSRQTRVNDIVRWLRDIRPERSLGVLLTGV